MAEPSYGHILMDGLDLPYVWHGGHRRIMAALPTPHGHLVRALPTWSEGVASGDLPDIPFASVPPFDHSRPDVPILDQDGIGSCLPHAWAAAVMLARAIMGAPFRLVSAPFLYTLVNRGVDAGSNAGDAYQALVQTGICPDDMVPHTAIRPAGYSAAAIAAAGRFKLRRAFRIEGFQQAVIAVSLGYAVTLDLCAGPGFDTDSKGVCGFLYGPNNHEVLACERYDGRNLGGRNSWGTQWGQRGRCWWQPRHLDDSQETYAVEAMQDDPDDAEMPPPFSATTPEAVSPAAAVLRLGQWSVGVELGLRFERDGDRAAYDRDMARVQAARSAEEVIEVGHELGLIPGPGA